MLSKANDGETLFLYLAVSSHALSAALVREDAKVQRPVYYISKRFTGAEKNYPKLEKLAYCLLIASRKLRPYFQAHPIKILTDQPLKQVLFRPETSGRLLKWNIELSQYDITYFPRRAINGQALADFIAEFMDRGDNEEDTTSEIMVQWKMYVDGARNDYCSGAGIVLETPEGRSLCYALRLEFPSTNNEAEYEALIAGLRIAKELNIKALQIFSDSELIVCQVKKEFQASKGNLPAYLTKTWELLNGFEHYSITHIPREG
ncbi:reverse transcriptase-like protein, partial [Pseudomonas aeruginosa]|uniref:reverse transcriptase-like protein n=1 Tax=Pseudomonas aeruginosa TaxID=287 RepID=UPI0027D3FD75